MRRTVKYELVTMTAGSLRVQILPLPQALMMLGVIHGTRNEGGVNSSPRVPGDLSKS